MSTTRLPRFHRAAEICPIALTERDRTIVRRVSEHRFLRSTHILSLTSGSRQQVLRRLQLLFHHGYLDRPLSQLNYYRSGSEPMVYALGNEGMRLLRREAGLAPGRFDWTTRNRKATRFFVDHAVTVADVLVRIELSSRLHGVEFLRADLDAPLKWKVHIRDHGTSVTTGVVPDAVFGLKSNTETRWFFLEVDRGTMPIERKALRQTSFMRKILAYQATWRQRVLKDKFPRFQVLTVTTTPSHVKGLLQALLRITPGLGLFLFTDERTLSSTEDIFKVPLSNALGKQVGF